MHYNSNRFQIQALLILSFSIFMFGVQDITEDYLFMSPAFKCKTESHGISILQSLQKGHFYSLEWIDCSEAQACKSKDFKTIVLFESLTSEFSLFCDKRYFKEWGIYLTFMISSLLSLVFLLFADSFGRKKILLVSYTICAGAAICIFFTSSVYSKVVGFTLLWSFHMILDITVFIFVNELTIGKVRRNANAILVSSMYLGGTLGNLVTSYLKNYYNLCILVFGGYFVFLVLLIFWIPKSPSLMLKIKAFEDFRKSVEYIRTVNKVEEPIKKEIEAILQDLVQGTLCF